MKGMMLLLGKRKPGDEPDESEAPDDDAPMSKDMEGDTEGVETDYAREAYRAVKDGDEDGFVDSFLGAVRACASKAKSAGYAKDDASEEE